MEAIAEYNKKIFIPELKEIFATKKEFKGLKDEVICTKGEVVSLKDEVGDIKDEFTNFKDETITNFDKIMKKLDILLDEKTVRKYQEEKQKKLWAIVLKSLKDHSILTNRELEAIAKLELF